MNDVEQIDAGVLSFGYVDMGPADGPAVLLLHGWPYDIHSFDKVVPLLTDAGCRVIVPYLRGYGTTSHRTIQGGVGHNLPQEAPAAFADAVLAVGGGTE